MITHAQYLSVSSLNIRLFGSYNVKQNGRPLPRTRTRTEQWLLAFLVLRHDREIERAWLAAQFWPDSRESQALYNLRRSLSDLRRVLGAEAYRLVSDTPHTIRLDLSGAAVDVIAFDEEIARGDRDSLERAVELHCGPLLEDCGEEWILPERNSREEAYLTALETLAAQSEVHGKHPESVHYLRLAVVCDPLRETTQQALLRELTAVGDFAGASAAFHQFRLRLHDELRVEPTPETTALYRQIRRESRQHRHASRAASSALPSRLPPSAASDICLCRLPCPLTSLIGRETEIESVVECLETARLVTLTGAGGVGKTRLAVAVAEEVAEGFPGGVFFVDAAPLSDPTLLWRTVATALNVREENGRPLRETLQAVLQARTFLLLLDNCEHLIEVCAHLAEALLTDCPGLRLLATSRQPLQIPGERVWRVPSLSVPQGSVFGIGCSVLGEPNTEHPTPNTDPLLEFDAVRLFVERASWANATFSLTPDNAGAVAQVCRRLDGIPLAIELAATRLRSLSVEEINDRLNRCFQLLTNGSRTAPPRQQTLRATIDWSYALLNAQEQTLLQRLAVFAGGWTLEAAEAVCFGESEEGVSLASEEVLDLLTSLTDKSLCQTEEVNRTTRYRLLETVWEYALEQLSKRERHEFARRHAHFFIHLAEEAQAHFAESDQKAWQDRLERDHDNLRATLDWCDAPDPERITLGLRLAALLGDFWEQRDYLSEGSRRLRALLARSDSETPSSERAGALRAAGNLAHVQGDFLQAEPLLRQALSVYRALQDERGEAAVLANMGEVRGNQADHEGARALMERALERHRALGDRWAEAQNLGFLGYLAREQEDYAESRALTEGALAIHRTLGDSVGEIWALGNLGYLAIREGDYEEARHMFEEARTLCRALNLHGEEAWALNGLAHVMRDKGELTTALTYLEQSLAIYRRRHDFSGIGWTLCERGETLMRRGDRKAAKAALQEALALLNLYGERKITERATKLLERIACA